MDRQLRRASESESESITGPRTIHDVCRLGWTDHVKRFLDQDAAQIDTPDECSWTPLVVASVHGQLEAASLLLANGALVDLPCHEGMTPLIIACQNGETQIAELLLSYGAAANLASADRSTPLIMACIGGHQDIVTLLLANEAAVDLPCDEGETPLIIACQYGHAGVAQRLLLHNRAMVNGPRPDGVTPLLIACSQGYTEVVELLLSHGAEADTAGPGGLTPLLIACQNGHAEIVTLLLSHKANVDLPCDDHVTPLSYASRNGHAEVVRLLLSRGASVNVPSIDGATPLIAASRNGHADAAKLLLCSNAMVDLASRSGVTPLLIACLSGRTEVVRLLLSHSADANKAAEDGLTPLIAVCQSGYTEIAMLLLCHGATVDLASQRKVTPLLIACQNGHSDVVDLLLSHGADTSTRRTGDLTTPLAIACQHGHAGVAQRLLLHNRAMVNGPRPDGVTPLLIACSQGYTEVVELLLSHGAEADTAGPGGLTPLLIACQNGHAEIVTLLLSHKANVGLRKYDGETPLFVACLQGHTEIVKMLLTCGADVNSVGRGGVSALIAACKSEEIPLLQLLLASGANVNSVTSDGVTALFIACSHGLTEIVKVLLNYHADLGRTCDEGATALITACHKGHTEIVALLLHEGAEINGASSVGATPLIIACSQSNTELTHLLLSLGARVDTASSNGLTPLWIACQNGHTDIVSLLLRYKATVDSPNYYGATPLHNACRKGHTKIVKMLLAHDATVDTVRHDGASALIIACQAGHTEVVRQLVSNGAKVNSFSLDGVTPLFFACQNGHQELVKLLLSHGAEVDVSCGEIGTPLRMASQAGRTEVVGLLLAYGAEIDRPGSDGATALIVACLKNHIEVAELLLSRGANVDVIGENGVTALTCACQAGHADLVQLLLSGGARLDLAIPKEMSPLPITSENGYTAVVRILLSNGATCDGGDISLFMASQAGHTKVVKLLLQHGANVDLSICDGMTPLFVACLKGHAEVVKVLLAHGDTVDTVRHDGVSALTIACQLGHTEVVRQLVSNGAKSSNSPTPDNKASSLASVSQKDHEEAGGRVSMLQEPQVANPDAMRDSPLIHAARNGHLQVVKDLIDNRASVDERNASGESALSAAASNGYSDVVKMLAEAGASVCTRDVNGNTPLIHAARRNDLETLALLIKTVFAARLASTLEPSLVPATLETLVDKTSETFEFGALLESVAVRLVGVYVHIESHKSLSKHSFRRFVMVVVRLIQLSAKCEASSVVTRLVVSRSILSAMEDLHIEIDFMLRGADMAVLSIADSDWRISWGNDVEDLLEAFKCELSEGALLLNGLMGNLDQVEEAIPLLENELQVHGDKCNPAFLELLETALRNSQRLFPSANAPILPEWFLPAHELDCCLDDFLQSANSHALLRSRWLNANVILRIAQIPISDFAGEINAWFLLKHPNVIKLYGVSHLRPPCFVVFENIASSSLRHYLSLAGNSHLLWQKLHEVALGLKYLHERGIVLGDLQCNMVWIGSDGLAKIAGVGLPRVPGYQLQSVCAMAPECLKGEKPTPASDVYSLSICMIEAIVGDDPWKKKRVGRIAYSVNLGSRPAAFESLGLPQRILLEQMWLFEPSKRINLANVVETLQTLAEQERRDATSSSRDSSPRIDRERVNGSIDLEGYVFPELESTIGDCLKKLKDKCKFCNDARCRAPALYIHERLAAVYATLLQAHKRPRTPVVTRYCEVLSSFKYFLKMTNNNEAVLQQAKSQRVALDYNVLHRAIDDVLVLLSAADSAGSVHDWKSRAVARMPGGARDLAGPHEEAKEPPKPSKQPVEFVENESSERVSCKFTQLDVDFESEQMLSDGFLNHRWFIPIDTLVYSRAHTIGKGAFGAVYKATWLRTPVVVKLMGYQEDGDEYVRRLFFHELRVWLPLHHPHVIKLFGACHLGKRYFVCEFAARGALGEYLKRGENQLKKWQKLHEVAVGLQYLHEQNVVHNDLKCDNFLVTADESAKITDFGLSCIPKVAEVKVAVKNQGAVHWKSPEYLRGEESTLASDVYSFGMCILEVMTGEPPWENLTAASIRLQVMKKRVLPPRPEVLSDDNQWNLIEMMCAFEPTHRLKIATVVEKLYEFAEQERAVKVVEPTESTPIAP